MGTNKWRNAQQDPIITHSLCRYEADQDVLDCSVSTTWAGTGHGLIHFARSLDSGPHRHFFFPRPRTTPTSTSTSTSTTRPTPSSEKRKLGARVLILVTGRAPRLGVCRRKRGQRAARGQGRSKSPDGGLLVGWCWCPVDETLERYSTLTDSTACC